MRTAIAALVAGAAVASAQLASGDWPQFGKSPSFQSFSSSGPSASPKHAEWTFDAGNRVVTSPAVSRGVVYAGSDSGEVFALNATTGAALWRYQAGAPVRSSPAVLEDGSVIIGCYSGDVLHISAKGALIAKAHTDYSVYAPVSVANGTAFVGSMDKHLYAIDIKTFGVRWKVLADNVVNSGTAVSADGTRAYFMDYSGTVFCVDTSSGAVKWKQGTGANGAGGSSPVLDGKGHLFIGSWSESGFAFDAETGEQLWKFDTHGEVESHAAWHDGTVYFSAEESHAVYAVDASDGSQVWSWDGATKELNGSPSLTPSLLFVGSNDQSMHCLRRSDGKPLFAVQAKANVFASAAVADDGWVYFADNTATLDEVRSLHAVMARAWDDCGAEPACALRAARALWERPTAAERDGSSAIGNVYAIDPSRHL